MTSSSDFTVQRAEEIVAGVNSDQRASFLNAVAFKAGIVPTDDAISRVTFPSDAAIDPASFVKQAGPFATATISAAGQTAKIRLVLHEDRWKLNSTGSGEDIVKGPKG